VTVKPNRLIILAAAFVIISMSLFTIGVFLTPIEESMGWSRSEIGAIGLFNWIVIGRGRCGVRLRVRPGEHAARGARGRGPARSGPGALRQQPGHPGPGSLTRWLISEYAWRLVLGNLAWALVVPCALISCIGMGLGSFAGGAVHDALGTYRALFLGSFAIASMAIVLGMTLRAPAGVPVPRPSPAMGG
jgi:hypothetical protein